MRQMHFRYTGREEFAAWLATFKSDLERTPNAQPLFRFVSDTSDRTIAEEASSFLRQEMPDTLFIGGSSGGNICDGAYVDSPAPNLSIACNVFESPKTRIEVHQFPLDEGHRTETAKAVLDLIETRPWVKAIEMITTIIDMNMNTFRADLSRMRSDIVFFGGGVVNEGDDFLYTGLPFVFSSDGDPDGHAIAFVLYGGDDFHAMTQAVVGWNPFGIPLKITRAEGPVLYELDGKPAYERYHHYLSIDNDEHFAERSLIFPLMLEYRGYGVIKAPLKVNDDGSIVLTSDLAPYHKQCRIAYGDPATILKSIKQAAINLQEFAPQGILAFSCAARLMYWGAEYIDYETRPFQSIAPTAGFFTGGEFSRDAGRVLHHNVTLVVVGLREGEPEAKPAGGIDLDEAEFDRQMTIIRSLAAFVSVTSAELQEAYDRMELLAKSDRLSGLWNRHEIEERITRALEANRGGEKAPCIIMLDIDDFKAVNDTYGHKAGDDVIEQMGSLLQAKSHGWPEASAGRWGGEEFMLLAPEATLESATALGRHICEEFHAIDFSASGRHSVSIGVAQAQPDETTDSLCQRVDKALYIAKEQGKNRVVVAR